MKVKVQKLDGTRPAGDIELNDAVFGVEPRADILHRVVTWQLENRRGTARADPRALRRRPHRQEVRPPEGRRHRPSRRSRGPDLHRRRQGPRRARCASSSSRSTRRSARSASRWRFRRKAKDGLVIVDSLELKDAKTKALKGTFDKAGWNGKVLVIDGDAVDARLRARRRQPAGRQRAAGRRRQRLRHPEARHAGPDQGRGRKAGGALQWLRSRQAGRCASLRRDPRPAHHREVDAALRAQRRRLQGRRTTPPSRRSRKRSRRCGRQGHGREHDRPRRARPSAGRASPYKRIGHEEGDRDAGRRPVDRRHRRRTGLNRWHSRTTTRPAPPGAA